VAVSATLNGVSVSKTFTQTFTAIVLAGYAGNETFTVASTLTLPATVTAGNGNDTIQLGGGNNTVALGDGNDTVSAGGGHNTVAVGNGNDVIQLGGGNNTVAAGNGNDTIQLGGGSNVVVEGNGNDSVMAGNGNNLIVGGLGQHTITLGNGTNILIDGSATVTNSGDSFRQILNTWTANPTASNQAAIRSRFTVNYNAKHANTLTAGTGVDWFFYKPPTTSNKKSTDFLN
jgi:Ca2+-binding RTX toxin-like protein